MQPFSDRRDAGRRLAGRLQRYAGRPDVLVLGLPRGGIPVAAEVGRALGAPLDLVAVRKVGVPSHPELAMGAMATIAGRTETVFNEEVMASLGRRKMAIQTFELVASRERVELARREASYRAGRPVVGLAGRIVILVDDGLATGCTMRAAAAAVRRHEPARLVIAVPVAIGTACRDVQDAADEIVCVWTPAAFRAVGQAYQNFEQTTDEEVRMLLATGGSNDAAGP
ncbi:phosphoribosyltransferase [Paenarthrobacter sp. Z7-10]|uniref:phosphoribosyltransferase n=1 Tax=Paenarthrobacter sp. Z7-10 TaxID=2787635 RepID=UPI0022A90CAF|nr:phosphoribosyltransferase [Paenarthrobacter sp. Z7-10]MCZ2402175.1 phosphoribosyltransferase [Paenarthrobacter sp. Z7-10]